MILLASTRKDVIARWKKSLPSHSIIFSNKFDSLKERLARIKPQVILLDYELPGLDGEKGIAKLVKLNIDSKIIVITPDMSDSKEWALYKTGIKGCCREDMSTEQIWRAIEVIQQGELYIRRTLTHLMLHELVAVTQERDRIEQSVRNLLENLTRREYEIAMLVGEGESNKRIARQLTITERTVKAHLTEIFRKLEIPDRVKLALIMKDATISPNNAQENIWPRQSTH